VYKEQVLVGEAMEFMVIFMVIMEALTMVGMVEALIMGGLTLEESVIQDMLKASE
jgi:hypothetical protein